MMSWEGMTRLLPVPVDDVDWPLDLFMSTTVVAVAVDEERFGDVTVLSSLSEPLPPPSLDLPALDSEVIPDWNAAVMAVTDEWRLWCWVSDEETSPEGGDNKGLSKGPDVLVILLLAISGGMNVDPIIVAPPVPGGVLIKNEDSCCTDGLGRYASNSCKGVALVADEFPFKTRILWIISLIS